MNFSCFLITGINIIIGFIFGQRIREFTPSLCVPVCPSDPVSEAVVHQSGGRPARLQDAAHAVGRRHRLLPRKGRDRAEIRTDAQLELVSVQALGVKEENLKEISLENKVAGPKRVMWHARLERFRNPWQLSQVSIR